MKNNTIYQTLIGILTVATLAACSSHESGITTSFSSRSEVSTALAQGKSERLEAGDPTVWIVAATPASTPTPAPKSYMNDQTRPVQRVSLSEGNAPTYDPDLVNPMVFDVYFYMNNYPDIAASFNGDADAATRHWVNTGAAEGRQGGPLFISKQYMEMYPDRVDDGDYIAAIKDFITYSAVDGLAGRFLLRPEIFNAYAFFYYNDELGAALDYDSTQAALYWVNQGVDEGLQGSDDFNAQAYLDRYPQMAKQVNSNYRRAAQNYILFGISQGDNASPSTWRKLLHNAFHRITNSADL